MLVGYNLYSRGILKQEHLRPLPGTPVAAENNFPETVLTLGDSHAGHLRGFLDYVGGRKGGKLKSCPSIRSVWFGWMRSWQTTRCAENTGMKLKKPKPFSLPNSMI
ncbi:trans-acylase [Neisseria gonorrhoeae]|nr:trans-acylase [Neisseria gonorrhoeae]